ncbi:MAG: CAP domain-containing protein [Pseudomonadota bacterium]|nr:CAP domain-containing protein [Pseudomonadota bacterium]
MSKLASAAFVLCCAWFAMPASAGIADDLNQIRSEGCDRRPGVAPLRASRELDEVAREWSKGGRLREALARSGYRATLSASMLAQGSADRKAILNVLKTQYCETLTEAKFEEIGVFQRRDAVWVVVAAPFVTPEVQDSAQVSRKVLALVNTARGTTRKCGRTEFQPAAPLALSAGLNRAALMHSQDMANQKFFEHVGSDGSKVGVRVTRAGYTWRAVGENIAIGAQTPEAVVQGWLDSPGHCANMMSPGFAEMGIAFVVDRKSEAGIYWTQVLATPR